MKAKLWRFGKSVAVIYFGVLVMLVLLERFFVYPIPSANDGDWAAENYRIESVDFASSDGTQLHGWFVDHTEAKAHVLFCHGNGEHVGYLTRWLRHLSDELDVAVFAFDYRGYGRSSGKPAEQGVLEDGEAAQKWLAERANIQCQDVVLYGRSLGGGVAVYLASEHGARGLVAERTFHSMVEIGAGKYPWAPIRWLMRNRYPSAERIAKYSGPLLQLHGSADQIVPLESAKTLFAACPSTDKTFLEEAGMGHNDPAPAEFFLAFADFVDRLPDPDSGDKVEPK